MSLVLDVVFHGYRKWSLGPSSAADELVHAGADVPLALHDLCVHLERERVTYAGEAPASYSNAQNARRSEWFVTADLIGCSPAFVLPLVSFVPCQS